MRLSLIPFAVLASLVASGCSEAPVELPVVAKLRSPIINGSVDNSGNYEEVVAVFTNMSKCTGTIIDKDEPFAFVLTAAHCVDDNAPEVVIQGVDHDSGSAIQYTVQDYAIHPGYNGSVNDFAMLRVTGAGSSTPTRAVLTPAEDNLDSGSHVFTHLGYGVIDTGPNPDTDTSLRHITTGSLSDTSSLSLTFNATSSGVCFGDSGGPNIHNATGKVAGVNSSVGGNSCNTESYSGRASAVLNTFITPYINNAPPPPVDCDGCFEAATTGNGSCSSQVNACFDNNTCDALVQCFNTCTTNSCIQNCSSMYSAGMPLYDAIFSCVCDSACMTECENASMCTGGTVPPTSTSVANSAVAANAAAATTGVGGGGAGGAGGAAPSTGTSQGWFPGDAENLDPKGTLANACAFDGSKSRDGWAWLALCALGVATRRRRRL
jgi:hypothetical protein